MRYLYLLLGGNFVPSCSQSVGSRPLPGNSQNQVTHAAGAKPDIKKISRIEPG